MRVFARVRILDLVLLTPVVVAVFVLKFYLALKDPVLHAVDPWLWAGIVEVYSKSPLEQVLSTTLIIPLAQYYPKGFPWLATLITDVARTSAYEVIRFYPAISSLNLIPMYFLSAFIWKSRRIAIVSVILVSLSRWYSIRTSIANPECFTHFWLAFSLIFLLRLDLENRWRNVVMSSLFITVTLMFWHLPIAIYVTFLALLAVVHFRNGSYLKRLLVTVALSILIVGSLWYFRIQWMALVNIITTHTFPSSVLQKPSMAYLQWMTYYLLSPQSWGYILPVLSVCGLAYTVASRNSRRDPLKVFLVIYLVSLLLLVTVAFFVLASLVLEFYFFSALALPLSIFGAVALIKAVDAFEALRANHMNARGLGPFRFPSAHSRRCVRALGLIAVIVVMITISNSANYGGECTTGDNCAFSWPFDGVRTHFTLKLNGETFPIVQVITFQYAKSIDAPSNDVYDALKWIRDHSADGSYVAAFLDTPPGREPWGNVIRQAFPTISERNFLNVTAFGSSLIQSPTDFRQKILAASGGDVYVVIGISSWIHEDWANPVLEAQFLDYAAQRPDLFSEVYHVEGVRVFHLTQDLLLARVDANISDLLQGHVRTDHIGPMKLRGSEAGFAVGSLVKADLSFCFALRTEKAPISLAELA